MSLPTIGSAYWLFGLPHLLRHEWRLSMTEHHAVTGKAPAARPQRISKREPIPFSLRETCSIRTAVEVSGIGRSKLYQMLADGRLKSRKIDKRRLIVVASLIALLRAPGTAEVAR
jgi:hypothetical protein